MKETMINTILSVLNPRLVTELVVEILYYLAQRSENTLDDKVVEAVAEKLDIRVGS